MTISELRKFYPHHEFYFFADNRELQKAPFLHAKIKGFEEVTENTIYIFMN